MGDGVARFFVTGHDNVERLVTEKPFGFVHDTLGERIKIGTVAWPQGTLQ